MSYSSDVKAEIIGHYPKSAHCKLAELAGIISVSGRNDELHNLIIRAENDAIEKKIIKLLTSLTGIKDNDIIRSNEQTHHRKLIISDKSIISEIYIKLKLSNCGTKINVDGIITERSCCKKAYLRGAFLAGGSVGSPEKSYQLEIAAVSKNEAGKLKDILSSFNLTSGVVLRRQRYVVYVKDGNSISSILGILGAVNSLMDFENVRILKDIRNTVNREVNCDSANLAKVANAANRQIEDIRLINEKIGIDNLPDNLRTVSRLRLEHPYLSIKELGEMLEPPLSKSAVNHRFRKLSELAEGLNKSKNDAEENV